MKSKLTFSALLLASALVASNITYAQEADAADYDPFAHDELYRCRQGDVADLELGHGE